MSLKSMVSARVSSFLLSERRRDKARARAESTRRRAGEPHRIEFFHQVDDPYSHLLAQALLLLEQRYEVRIDTWLVAPPDASAAPEPERLESYALTDARRLARKAGLRFDARELPERDRIDSAQRIVVDSLGR